MGHCLYLHPKGRDRSPYCQPRYSFPDTDSRHLHLKVKRIGKNEIKYAIKS